MQDKIGEDRIRLYPSDWRWSATIVGLCKYFEYHSISYDLEEEYVEFDKDDITEEKYLMFAENHFSELMHHKIVEDLLEIDKPSDEQIKKVNEKISKNITSNTVMIKVFKGIKYGGENSQKLVDIINKNRLELIKETFKGGRSLYYNFCNENSLLLDQSKSCRLRGYSVDMGKKSKSVSYMRDKKTFVYQDSKYFDFIPFGFSKTNSKVRDTFFINNNFTIKQLINTNKIILLDDEDSTRKKLFFSTQKSASYIDYDVEVIKKERENDYFESIFVRKNAICIFDKINEDMLAILSKPCNAKTSEKSQDVWINIEKVVTEGILNNLKLDYLIEKLFKSSNNHKFLISHLIGINNLIYEGGEKMTDNQKKAYGAAMEIKGVLKGKENKIRAYEQRLISAITLKDYDRVQEVLLQLSAFTQVRMDFLLDVFENFEENKNLVYTFINTLGEKKTINNTKGEIK